MAIQLLPPQLANQIAAGEVVERPASVIKELVENSIDAGASKIDIEIEKGGAKLIRIRDNGSGIPQAELALALSRHATSKVATLEDLEAILSFGFRGEALASISAVSRLTLTSRTAAQSEAWAAYAEGSQMAVKVIPAAHPVGTTIEVVDLFFNTPARRRFLKSDKTEFTHIDEWLKRIACVRADIQFTLSHNGKTIRHYRPATTETQYSQRLGQICGQAFAQQALRIDCSHEGLSLKGYLAPPSFNQSNPSSDIQYFYVNQRLVRDKLVNHAIRQALSGYQAQSQTQTQNNVAFVFMLSLDPQQVDVNVHPAKHEVRFHQSRFVHDFILQTLQSALQQSQPLLPDSETSERSPSPRTQSSSLPTSAATTRSSTAPPTTTWSSADRLATDYPRSQSYLSSPSASTVRQSSSPNQRDYLAQSRISPAQQQAAAAAYGQLLQTETVNEIDNRLKNTQTAELNSMPALLNATYWVQIIEDKLLLVDIRLVHRQCLAAQIKEKLPTGLVAQPLLMPITFTSEVDWARVLEQHETLFRQLGLSFSLQGQRLIIKKVPPYLRNSQLTDCIPELMHWLTQDTPSHEALAHWLAGIACSKQPLSATEIWQLLQLRSLEEQQQILSRGMSLPWQSWLEEQTSE